MANLELSFPAAADLGLSIRHFDIAEGLSRPFEAVLVAASSDPDLDFDRVVGKAARCRIDRGALGARTWTGVCSSIEQIDTEPDGLSLYAVRVVPRLWLLSQRRGHRVFQHLTAPAIARALLAEWGIEPELRLDEARFPSYEHRVQYGESDLAFLSRLFEDAAVSYFFEEHEGDSRLVLADAPERGEPRRGALVYAAMPISASQVPYLADARLGSEVRAGAVVVRDASLREGRTKLSFATNLVDVAPGTVFSIEGAPRPDLGPDQRFCVVSTSLKGAADAEWSVTAVAAPCATPVRPARRTPRPRIEGVQSAIVVGPRAAGDDSPDEAGPREEIHVDELGRVRLRFAWDREGARDGSRAPWARVAEGWAGAGWGMVAAPRVGQEVLVGFFEGDPDQPVVVGRVHGASSPSPLSLPGERSKSVWRSRSTPGSGGYHEIAFEDRYRHELIHLLSERDLEKVVKRDEVERTGDDRTATVGGHVTTTIDGDDVVTVGGLHTVSMADGATRREIRARRITLTTGSATIQLDGPDITVTGRSGVHIQAGGTVSIQGEPHVHINPPGQSGDAAAPAKPDTSHLVWFKLVSEGTPIAGARCHVVHEDGSTSATHVTDGNGLVRFHVDTPGSYHVALGRHETAARKLAASASAPAEPSAPSAPAAKKVIHIGKTPAQPSKKATPTEHEVPIEIEIISPRHDTTYHLHTKPSMPTIPLEARVLVQGEPVSIGSVRWQFHVSGKYRVRDEAGSGFRLQEHKLPAGHARTSPGEEKKFELAPAALVGGDLHIKAVFHGGPELGGVTASRKVKGCRVLGKSAPRRDVEAFIAERGGDLAWLYLRMFCHESAHTLEQFAKGSGGGNAPGFPLYGPPAGVGIVQRDPMAGEWHFPKGRITRPNNFFPRIFWDWHKNVNEGISSFRGDYIERGRRDLDLLRKNHPHLPMYPEGVLLRAAIRRYNGGIEFGASGDGRHYVVHPTFTNNPGYVSSVLDDPHVDDAKYPVPADARATRWPR